MNNQARVAIMAAAVAALVVAFVLANDSSDSDKPDKTVTVTQTESTGGTTVETTTKADPIDTVVVKDGKPVGGIKTLSFANGEQIEFTIESDSAEEIHVHGYDLKKNVDAGGSVTFKFKATIEGLFEVELEGPGVEILTLEVTP